jgi:ribosomal protein L37AE/L43A
MSIRVLEERFEMNDMSCPWCEADLVLRVISDEQTCAECGTSWSFEDETAEELPLAA